MGNLLYTGSKKGGLILVMMVLFIVFSNNTMAQIQKVERNAPPMEQLPQEQNQLAVSYDEEIKEDELPESVISSINDNYSGFELAKIYRGSDGSYKIKLEKEDETMAAFYDAAGEFIRVEDKTDNEDETINDDWR
jgi:hypothetical protein